MESWSVFLFKVLFIQVDMGTPQKSNMDTRQVSCLKGVTVFQGPSFWVSIRQFSGMCNKVCFFVKGQNFKEKNK